MRKLLAILLLAASPLLAQTAPGPATSPTPNAQTPVDPYAAKARAMVDQMIQALGGQAYLTFKTRTESGRTYSFYQGQPRGTGTLYWRMWEYPDKDRIELTKQRDISYLVLGDAGYEITFRGTALMEAEALADALRRRNHSLEIVTRQWLPDAKTIVLPAGTAVVEQKLCDVVTVINGKNDSVTLAIDHNTHLPVQNSFSYRDKDQYKVQEAEVFANYRLEQGIQTPFTWTRKKDGLMLSQRFLNDVQYNVAIPPEKFEAKVNYDPKQLEKQK